MTRNRALICTDTEVPPVREDVFLTADDVKHHRGSVVDAWIVTG